MYCFKAFDWNISSEIDFPELLPCTDSTSATDVQIIFGEVASTGLVDIIQSGVFFQANENHFWLNIPNIARFLVSFGNVIVVDSNSNINDTDLRAFILDVCFKALLIQQNRIVWEGCAVKVGSNAVLFVMPSGYGKSTLASLFLEKGYQILTDEICAIRHDGYLIPSHPNIHVWLNIANQLKISLTSQACIREPIDKYRLPLSSKFYAEPLPIKLIYILDYHKKNSFLVSELSTKEKISELSSKLFIPPYALKEQNQDQLVYDIPMIKLVSPRWEHSFNQLGLLLSQEFEKIENDILKRVECYEQV